MFQLYASYPVSNKVLHAQLKKYMDVCSRNGCPDGLFV